MRSAPTLPAALRPTTPITFSIAQPGKVTDNLIRDAFQRVDREAFKIGKSLDVDPSRFERITPEQMPVIRGLSRLVSDDFPFDESQLNAVLGMTEQQYACLTGAAGTGKTTVTKKLIDSLLVSASTINVAGYWNKGGGNQNAPDQIDRYVPAIAACTFTGKASQMIKKNFPSDWHPNIMTIHRMLGFVPEYYEDWGGEKGSPVLQKPKMKMRFVPTYTAENPLPWDIIVIDEAGMLGLDLWNQLWAACLPTTRIYMIGDINQLPPVHGRSIFGFAMTRWPTFELTHIHRQKGEHNPIVDAAWEVIHGKMPKASPGNEMLDPTKAGFYMHEIKGGVELASKTLRAAMNLLRDKGVYEPLRDTVIVATNGHDPESASYPIGQIPINNSVAVLFNTHPDRPRYRIDCGREHRDFAVGDKVMATRNDHESGITNGMQGVIREITVNGEWIGDDTKFGSLDRIRAIHSGDEAKRIDSELSQADVDLDYEALMGSLEIDAANLDKEENRGPASHIVRVEFGHDTDQPVTIVFSTLAEVASVMLSYVVTGHKMQGGEAPVIIILAHDSNRRMIYREWLYTCITRASLKCIVFYSRIALKGGIGTRRIKGNTLAEKVQSFVALSDTKNNPLAIKVRLPDPRLSTRNEVEAKR